MPKICTGCKVSAAKLFLYHSSKKAKVRPHWSVHFCPEHWFMTRGARTFSYNLAKQFIVKQQVKS